MGKEANKLTERFAVIQKNDLKRMAAILGTQYYISRFIAQNTGQKEEEVFAEIQETIKTCEHLMLGHLQDTNPRIASFWNKVGKRFAAQKKQNQPRPPESPETP
jgi:hypothetical protein